MIHTVYIGLGSNLNSPYTQVNAAINALQTLPNTQLVSHSPWYQSKAIGPEQPDYINGVAKLATSLAPIELLDALQAIEQAHHRVRKEHWGPRTLDLDILLWGGITIKTDRLLVPHPYLEERNFVLLPLNDISPELILPNQKSIAELVHSCDKNGISLYLPNE